MIATDLLSLYIVTWNVAQIAPPSNLDLTDVLNLQSSTPDFYVVGLQEALPQIPISKNLRNKWEKLFDNVLKRYNYVKVKKSQLLGMVMHVFTLEKHKMHIKNMEVRQTGTGLFNRYGNKGTVSFRMDFQGVSMCFLNSHFAAFEKKVNKRIKDYWTTLLSQKFKLNPKTPFIYSHDHIFWFGDLNFRLNSDLSSHKIIEKVNEGHIKELFEFDELTSLMNDRLLFCDMKENVPDFPPTFKYQRGTNNYQHKRRPAWTDRILFKDNGRVTQVSYRSVESVSISDHKPVVAEFSIPLSDQGVQNFQANKCPYETSFRLFSESSEGTLGLNPFTGLVQSFITTPGALLPRTFKKGLKQYRCKQKFKSDYQG